MYQKDRGTGTMKSTKAMIYIMIIVLFAGGIYLFATGHDEKGALKGIDPQSYDIVTKCSKIDGNNIICNEGNDQFLVLNDTTVYKDKIDATIEENGTINTEHLYSEITGEELEAFIKEQGEAVVKLWMTPNGKIDCVMAVEKKVENNSRTLKQLNGLQPENYSSENVVLKMSKEKITLAPANYTDENKEKLSEFIKTYRLSDKTKYYHIDLVNDVKYDKEHAREEDIPKSVVYSEYDFKETRKVLKNQEHAFVWLDENGNITTIMTIHVTRNMQNDIDK